VEEEVPPTGESGGEAAIAVAAAGAAATVRRGNRVDVVALTEGREVADCDEVEEGAGEAWPITWRE